MNSVEVACYLCLTPNIALLKTCSTHPAVVCVECMTRDVPATCLYPGCSRPYRWTLPPPAAERPSSPLPHPAALTVSSWESEMEATLDETNENLERIRQMVIAMEGARAASRARAPAPAGTLESAFALARSQRRRAREEYETEIAAARAAPAAVRARVLAAPAAAPAAAVRAPEAAVRAPEAAVRARAPEAAAAAPAPAPSSPPIMGGWPVKYCRFCNKAYHYQRALVMHEVRRCPIRLQRQSPREAAQEDRVHIVL